MFTNLNPIVILWLVPVILQIVVPLVLLFSWGVYRIVKKFVRNIWVEQRTGRVILKEQSYA